MLHAPGKGGTLGTNVHGKKGQSTYVHRKYHAWYTGTQKYSGAII